jgi:hypothetical protein
VTSSGGAQERVGPYQFVRAAEGALFVNGKCLGIYSPKWNEESDTHRWQEVTLLAAAGETA